MAEKAMGEREREKKMGKVQKEQLLHTLSLHLNTIHETLQLLDQTPASTLDRVKWEEVVQMGEQLKKQATITGLLSAEESPDLKMLEENMATYFNMLQGLLLLSHGSKVGAGPTLSSSIQASVKQVVDCSFMMFKEAMACYGSRNRERRSTVPQLVGALWDSCAALKKNPATNVTAIGRALTNVAVTVKDVLREMKELKPASSYPEDESKDVSSPAESSADAEGKHDDDDGDDDDPGEGDLGNDLSPEEMKIAQLAIQVVSETLVVLKELIRSITSLHKRENPKGSNDLVNSLEKLLKQCQGIGVQIDELGACLYPPQEVSAMRNALSKISNISNELQSEVECMKGSLEPLSQALNGLKTAIRQLESGLVSSDSDLVSEMEKLDVNNQ
ncbi:hypothetical protein RJ641_012173 [Dillenia turbinata]|uniref:Cyclin-D1-binding protein 1 n=1 Tax=Dillenia turbinata TaxID=194707 RepID=A0AAN8V0Y6_9MAGN